MVWLLGANISCAATGDVMTQAIHIFGASGSGTTSLGQALSEEPQIPHLDTDDYYWKQTDPPFVEKHEPSDRIRMIERDTAGHEAWVLSGSVCSWGGPLVGHFALAVFLRLAPSIRMARYTRGNASAMAPEST
jgi:adenylate kinase family enzyme